jgi:hypothetical protein
VVAASITGIFIYRHKKPQNGSFYQGLGRWGRVYSNAIPLPFEELMAKAVLAVILEIELFLV